MAVNASALVAVAIDDVVQFSMNLVLHCTAQASTRGSWRAVLVCVHFGFSLHRRTRVASILSTLELARQDGRRPAQRHTVWYTAILRIGSSRNLSHFPPPFLARPHRPPADSSAVARAHRGLEFPILTRHRRRGEMTQPHEQPLNREIPNERRSVREVRREQALKTELCEGWWGNVGWWPGRGRSGLAIRSERGAGSPGSPHSEL